MVQSLAELGARLASRVAVVGTESGRQAAVAAVLRERDAALGPEVLLIRRAERAGDPWSGHMAFPGGRREPNDADLLATALRETHEEVGLDLTAHARLLGRLDDVDAVARGQRVGMVIAPYIFALHADVPLAPGAGEVAEALWAPVLPLYRGDSRTTYPYTHGAVRYDLPAHRVGDRIVWGLTYHMLEALFHIARTS